MPKKIKMEKIRCQIDSQEEVEVILGKLKNITIENQPFLKPKGIHFLGKINGDSFQLITFNSPPMTFDFNVNQDRIDFEYRKESLSKTFKGLIYAMMIPLFVGLWLWGMIDSDVELKGKIVLSAFLLIPFLFNKVIKMIYEHFVLPKDDKFIVKLEKILAVKIEKSTGTNQS